MPVARQNWKTGKTIFDFEFWLPISFSCPVSKISKKKGKLNILHVGFIHKVLNISQYSYKKVLNMINREKYHLFNIQKVFFFLNNSTRTIILHFRWRLPKFSDWRYKLFFSFISCVFVLFFVSITQYFVLSNGNKVQIIAYGIRKETKTIFDRI